MIAAMNETFILVKKASVTAVPINASPGMCRRRTGAARMAKYFIDDGVTADKSDARSRAALLISRERSSAR